MSWKGTSTGLTTRAGKDRYGTPRCGESRLSGVGTASGKPTEQDLQGVPILVHCIATRCKEKGRTWTYAGARAIAALEVARRNGELTFWRSNETLPDWNAPSAL